MTFANEYGECIEGNCENGQGTYLVGDDWAVNSIYIGEYKNGRPDGQGTLILNGDNNGNPNGVTLIGTFKEGKTLDVQLIHDKFNQERIRIESKKRNGKLYVKDTKEKRIKEIEKGKNNQIKKNLAMIQSAACQNFHNFVETKFSRIQVNFFGDLKSQLETLVREKDIIFGNWIIFSGDYYDIPEEPFIVCGIPLHKQYKQFENSLNQHGIMVARWLEGYDMKGN
tara:strand:+ start:303 stop:977 length:675 start_codon:yes stop_codon:yes gene_type:complete